MHPVLLALFFVSRAPAADPITDEALRLKVLAAIFPDGEIERIERRIDSSMRLDTRPPLAFPDALALVPAYHVPGAPQDERERCAAQDQVGRSTSSQRELRLRLFPWPGATRGELLAVVQYRFVDAKPVASCASLAGLFRLSPTPKGWNVVDRFPLDSNRHHHLEGLRFLSLTGEPEPELVVESDAGDGVRFQSDLHILMLVHGRFQELLNVPSRFHLNVQGDQWSQKLDQARTLAQQGEQFCFEKTVWAAGHRRFDVPQVSYPCYSRGTGVGSAAR
jgi:hypothetical protein